MGDTVTLTLDYSLYLELLLALGIADGAAFRNGAPRHARLLDAINVGNPNYKPYNIAPEPQETT